jgi:transketolase
MTPADRQRELGQQLRVDSVRASAAAGSGHPTSSMSAADLMAVLLDGGYLRMDTRDLRNPANDHLIFSKGHASPLYYSVLKAAGIVDDAELLTFREFQSRLEGHPTPRIPPTEVATGSLGQGLPIAVGVALCGKRLDRLPYRVWCLCGDSARRARRWSAGTSTATCAARRRSAGTRSRSTATTSRRSHAPTTRRSRPPASPPRSSRRP